MESLVLSVIIAASAAAAFFALRAHRARLRGPVLTLSVAAVTLAVSVVGELAHPVLDLLDRNAPALAAGQWWRAISPLLVQDGGWPGTITNTVSLLVLGVLVESLVSRPTWLVAYVASGLAGEAAAYTVLPHQGFAGNSVAILGLAGMAAIAILTHGPARARVPAAIALLLGIGLLVVGNLHGIGFCAGTVVGIVVVALPRSRRAVRYDTGGSVA